MGNCQAAEAATVVIVHPGGKIERIYWSSSATNIMNSNPGHYVAQVVTSPSAKSEDGKPLKHLKLLRPEDTLHIGQVYRLISFEDVLKEFAAKKCVKLGKLIKETAGISAGEVKIRKQKRQQRRGGGAAAAAAAGGEGKTTATATSSSAVQVEQEPHRPASSSSSDNIMNSGSSSSSRGVVGRHQHYYQTGQWRPALQSIAEVGS